MAPKLSLVHSSMQVELLCAPRQHPSFLLYPCLVIRNQQSIHSACCITLQATNCGFLLLQDCLEFLLLTIVSLCQVLLSAQGYIQPLG